MGKGAGVIAYTKKGYVLIAYENVKRWSFPKGHRIIKSGYKEPWIENAEREFREETNFPHHIELDEEMKTNTGGTYLYFYEMSPKEVGLMYPDGKEILSLMWIHIDDLDAFRNENEVNKTISDLNIKNFKRKTGVKDKPKPLNPYAKEFVYSFRKSIRKLRKSIRK